MKAADNDDDDGEEEEDDEDDEEEEDDDEVVEEEEYGTINHKNYGQNSRRAYLSELRKVIERSDVILQVLDARDPMGKKD